MMSNQQIGVIDLFSGAGGFSLGFKMAGLKLILAVDNDKSSCDTYQKNLKTKTVCKDIRLINREYIIKEVGKELTENLILIGGPPCQGFSIQRRGSDDDERNNLVLEFLRLVSELKPVFFVMENVGGILSSRGSSVLNNLNQCLTKLDYFIHMKKISAAEYGVPQMRKRVFIIGEKNKSGFARYQFPKPTTQKDQLNVKDFIRDLMSRNEDEIPNHRADKLTPLNIERIKSLKPGDGRDSLPEKLQLKCHKQNEKHRHKDVYGRMPWYGLAPTITARFDSFSRGRFGHPELNRSITLREGARLQTFPDDFVFEGSKVEIAKQIGNAVPPLLAEQIGGSIVKTINSYEKLA